MSVRDEQHRPVSEGVAAGFPRRSDQIVDLVRCQVGARPSIVLIRQAALAGSRVDFQQFAFRRGSLLALQGHDFRHVVLQTFNKRYILLRV